MGKIREILNKHSAVCCDCSARYGNINACKKCAFADKTEKRIKKLILSKEDILRLLLNVPLENNNIKDRPAANTYMRLAKSITVELKNRLFGDK